jgi:Domain of unknown function (DUF4126)
MEILQTLSIALGLATLSGINLYLTVFVTGLAIRLEWIHLAPQYASLQVLAEPSILVISGVLFALEFFADKIPWVDSVWDAVHTVIRPIGGALLAIQVLGDTSPVFEVIVGLLAGTASFASHSVKAGTRLVANGSPEPFSNIALSFTEDVVVVGFLSLLWANPTVAFLLLVVFFTAAIYFLPKLWRATRARIHFALKKLNQSGSTGRSVQLSNKLPSRYDMAFHRATGSEKPIAWNAPCVSGKGKHLDSNRFGYLVATDENPFKVYFLTLGWFGANSRLLEIEGFKAGLEERFLFDELHIYSPGKNQRYTLRFDKANAALAQQVYQTLENRITVTKPLTLAAPTEPV